MDDTNSIRIITWNIQHDDVDRAERAQLLAQTVREQKPDILCLQEAWPELSSVIAEVTGMRHIVSRAASTGRISSLLSHLPLADGVTVESVELPGWDGSGQRYAAVSATFVSPSLRRWRVTSSHLAWGANMEGVRLEQLQYIDAMSEAALRRSPQDVHVLCGDLNALPHGRALRFMTGLDLGPNGECTHWVDTWGAVGTGEGHTSDPTLARAELSARSAGILRRDLLPSRRIDYVLVRGFAYGRPGSPLACSLLPGDPITDHHGIVADLWDPKAQTTS